MQPNVIIEKRELANGLFKSRFAVDLNLANRAFKGAEKAFDAAIHPRRMGIASLMLDSERMHRQRKVGRNQSAIIIGAQRFGFAKGFKKLRQSAQNGFCASVRKTQRQQAAAAVVNHAQQRVGFAANRHVRPIQRPGLIRLLRPGWLPHYFAQLQDFIAAFFTQRGDVAFADRFTAKGEARIEHRRHRAAPRMAARDRKQTQYFRLHPAGFAVFACAIALSLSVSGQLAAGELVRGGVLSVSAAQMLADANEKQEQSRQQNTKSKQDHHGFLCKRPPQPSFALGF